MTWITQLVRGRTRTGNEVCLTRKLPGYTASLSSLAFSTSLSPGVTYLLTLLLCFLYGLLFFYLLMPVGPMMLPSMLFSLILTPSDGPHSCLMLQLLVYANDLPSVILACTSCSFQFQHSHSVTS